MFNSAVGKLDFEIINSVKLIPGKIEENEEKKLEPNMRV
jgi:hypothetical protein